MVLLTNAQEEENGMNQNTLLRGERPHSAPGIQLFAEFSSLDQDSPVMNHLGREGVKKLKKLTIRKNFVEVFLWETFEIEGVGDQEKEKGEELDHRTTEPNQITEGVELTTDKVDQGEEEIEKENQEEEESKTHSEEIDQETEAPEKVTEEDQVTDETVTRIARQAHDEEDQEYYGFVDVGFG